MSMNIDLHPKTTPTKAGNLLVEHPEHIKAGTWWRVTVAVLRSGQTRPYADSVTVAEIAFEGGCGSNMPGYDLPHASRPPKEYVLEMARAFFPFKDKPGMGDTQLMELVEIEKAEGYTIWRATLVTPYMD